MPEKCPSQNLTILAVFMSLVGVFYCPRLLKCLYGFSMRFYGYYARLVYLPERLRLAPCCVLGAYMPFTAFLRPSVGVYAFATLKGFYGLSVAFCGYVVPFDRSPLARNAEKPPRRIFAKKGAFYKTAQKAAILGFLYSVFPAVGIEPTQARQEREKGG